MGSVLGSISACIMEIFRMSDTEGLSPGGPQLDSGISLAAASALLLNTCDGWWEPPKVILVTVALCVMIGCCEGGGDISTRGKNKRGPSLGCPSHCFFIAFEEATKSPVTSW